VKYVIKEIKNDESKEKETKILKKKLKN